MFLIDGYIKATTYCIEMGTTRQKESEQTARHVKKDARIRSKGSRERDDLIEDQMTCPKSG